MKLELGKIEIRDIQFADRTCIEDHILYVNKEEVEKLVLEDDKLLECHLCEGKRRRGDIPGCDREGIADGRGRPDTCP